MQRGRSFASISFGFPDDDNEYVQAVDELMRDELSLVHPHVKFAAFDFRCGNVKRLRSHLSDPKMHKAVPHTSG